MKKFKVTLANNKVFHVHRNSYDIFTEGWSFEGLGSIMFREDSIDSQVENNIGGEIITTMKNEKKNGEKVRIQKHWIITIEEE